MYYNPFVLGPLSLLVAVNPRFFSSRIYMREGGKAISIWAQHGTTLARRKMTLGMKITIKFICENFSSEIRFFVDKKDRCFPTFFDDHLLLKQRPFFLKLLGEDKPT